MLTPKQERFCLAYIETGNASEAYRRAYGAAKQKQATANRAAKRLMDLSKICTRLAELRAEHQEAHNVTVGSLTGELEEVRRLAIENGQAAAAVQASMGKAKLHGLLTDRREDASTPVTVNITFGDG